MEELFAAEAKYHRENTSLLSGNALPLKQSACKRAIIISTRVDVTNYRLACDTISRWAVNPGSRYVCVAPVSSIMEAHDSTEFETIINTADMVTPDGMPVVWSLRLLGHNEASRVYGPDLTSFLLECANSEHISVGFHGGTPESLARLLVVVGERYPALRVAWADSPPFRELSQDEDEEITCQINRSGARIIFVGLGSPKQERWMASHRGRVEGVMVGVGAAFDFLSGTKPQAPRWMMRSGVEWLFRLATEPRRLWKRYLLHNPRFVALMTKQWLETKLSRSHRVY